MFGVITAPTRPPGGGCEQGRAGQKSAQPKTRGGSGGTARGLLGAHCESEHAHHTTQAHNEPYARYNWREGGRRFTAQSLKKPTSNGDRNAPAPPASGNHFVRDKRKNTCFFSLANKRFCEGTPR